MANTKNSGLTELAEAPNDADLLAVVDVSDTTMAATGTNKKITAANLKSGLATSTDLSTHTSDTSNPHSVTADQVLPTQTTHSGKFLTTDGTNSSWGTPSGTGDVTGPASSTDNHIPQFDGTSGKAIKDGLGLVTTVGTPGADTNVPSEAAVRAAIVAAGGGDVAGPASSTDNAIVRFDSTTGKIIQNSSATVADTGGINIPTGETYNINGSPHTHTGLVTNGDSHDHNGGDVAQIDHVNLANKGTNTHAQIDTFISSKASASGLASLDGSSLVVQNPANATATPTASKIVIADGSGKVDGWVSAASDTAAGKVELATAAETTTGTDTGRAITPDGLAGSDYGKRIVEVKVIDDATALTTGDGKAIFVIPAALNGYNLVAAHAAVTTVSSSGTPTYQIRNVTDSQDMLSTRITIDANEFTSYTAATAPVINTATDDVATGDRIAIDKDVAGTGEKGDTIVLTFQLP